jgi:hypothetical protein
MKLSTLLVAVTGFTIILSGAGCSSLGLTKASKVIESQTPGVAEGAGASVTGPSNSAAPTTQIAERRTAFYPGPKVQWPLPKTGIQSPAASDPVTVAQPPQTEPQYPAWQYEKVETTIGQHQDAAGIVKAAQVASGWSSVRWLGILITIIGIGGMLWSYNNEHGYPLVFLKVTAIGVIITIIGSNPWFLLLLLIPLGFYALQRLNLLRLPL